ncbi:hypothetical protein Tco_1025992, partial [Tanacetum coccineum]
MNCNAVGDNEVEDSSKNKDLQKKQEKKVRKNVVKKTIQVEKAMSDNEDDNTNRNKELPKKSRKKVATKNVVEQTVEMQKSIKSELLYACDMEECDLKCIRLYADVYRDEL